MVATPLVEPLKEAGERLVRDLDQAGFPVKAALWLYFTEAAEWRFVLASPLVDSVGPRETYETLQRLLLEHPSAIQLQDISARSPDDSLIQLIRSVVKTGPTVSGIRLTGNSIRGVYIEDAYIYRTV